MDKIANLAAELYRECSESNLGDPFVPGRLQEIIMAGILGHKISDTLSGADGYDDRGPCEYKSTIKNIITGAYKGISLHTTWDEQCLYHHRKYGNMNHYIGRFANGRLVEVWKLDGEDVIKVLTPRLKKQYESTKPRKDPRLAVTLSQRDIYKYGERII